MHHAVVTQVKDMSMYMEGSVGAAWTMRVLHLESTHLPAIST